MVVRISSVDDGVYIMQSAVLNISS